MSHEQIDSEPCDLTLAKRDFYRKYFPYIKGDLKGSKGKQSTHTLTHSLTHSIYSCYRREATCYWASHEQIDFELGDLTLVRMDFYREHFLLMIRDGNVVHASSCVAVKLKLPNNPLTIYLVLQNNDYIKHLNDKLRQRCSCVVWGVICNIIQLYAS